MPGLVESVCSSRYLMLNLLIKISEGIISVCSFHYCQDQYSILTKFLEENSHYELTFISSLVFLVAGETRVHLETISNEIRISLSN